MASSKLMTTTSTSNQNSPPHQSIYPSPLTSLLSDPPQIDTEDFFKNIYCSPPPPPSTIVDGCDKRMTLEDYLNKEVTACVDDNTGALYHGTGVTVAGNGTQSQGAAVVMDGGGSGRGRGRRRVAEETPLDKASQQKQRRMIKNRESAARSRERKQAYTVELESLVMQLGEENARLQREEAEENKRRYKQLMKDLIPVTEKQIPGPPQPGILRRVLSMWW